MKTAPLSLPREVGVAAARVVVVLQGWAGAQEGGRSCRGSRSNSLASRYPSIAQVKRVARSVRVNPPKSPRRTLRITTRRSVWSCL